jgi:hypothetical protein
LLRKKEIQRRQFIIQQPGETPPEGCTCQSGWRLNGTPCPCSKGEQHRALLRKWGMQI